MKPILLHIPHSSLRIPDYSMYIIPENEVNIEAQRLSDLYTDELFEGLNFDIQIKADFCRIFCDVERFENDHLEPMSRFGMGATYTHCDDGRQLRIMTKSQRNQILETYFFPHHSILTKAVDDQLSMFGEALIIDCHSFPDIPLNCSLYQGSEKFDFNIGTDSFHTPKRWIDLSIDFFQSKGYKLGVNEPYAGSMVPMKHFQKISEVKSIMLEVNRSLYMSDNFLKNDNFDTIKGIISLFIETIRGD